MRRRDFLTTLAGVSAAAAAHPLDALGQAAPAVDIGQRIRRKGRVKQGLMRNQFPMGMSFDDMCREAARQGAYGFDLIAPADWPTLRKYGLEPLMAPSTGVTFQDGLIHPEAHDAVEKSMRQFIDVCAAGGVKKMITVGGQRRGMSYTEAARNCVAFFNRIRYYAEEKDVTICIEVMNTKFTDNILGRPDQICDHLSWAVEVCSRVNSPKIRTLFDIYHVQIMDGNVADNIKQNIQWISHFHTGGVPGRREIDDTQELNYRYLAQVIAESGFTGHVTHEWRPTPGRDPLKSLAQALDIMDV